MSISRDDLQSALEAVFAPTDINISDLAGDNDHWKAEITSSKFEGLTRIAQHRLVQNAVANYDIHALAIHTKVA